MAITVFSRPALNLLTTPGFRSAARFIPLIVAAYVIRGLGDQFRNVFLMENRTGSDAQISTVGSLVVPGGVRRADSALQDVGRGGGHADRFRGPGGVLLLEIAAHQEISLRSPGAW